MGGSFECSVVGQLHGRGGSVVGQLHGRGVVL